MKINWKVRFKNKIWITGFVAQLLILTELLLIGAHAAGLTDFHVTEEMKDWIFAFVNVVFGLFATLGIIQDPTTSNFADSNRAMKYIKPK
ncbi:phage holin [Psychrobacillus lasiicapitis]|uniref:Phage holin n=1 Tax=Psychrobacillus lasiicapitis TaxID=1636719 RepID=A0A544T6G8_9BACI|nr:phage holin [Psychrobacillus lasiicapitis]TQR13043.1 phage holin [Psychrobacillus lasiicapitis]GGA34952.1 holin [Psychrobacillus lasiicapitis]